MWRYCICILVRSTLRFSTPFPAHQTSDMRECRLPGLGIDRYSCQFVSGLDKICLYLSLYFIYAVTYPMLKKKIIIATDNQVAKWWLQLANNKILFIYKGVCKFELIWEIHFYPLVILHKQIPTDSVFISLWSLSMITTFVDWLFLYFICNKLCRSCEMLFYLNHLRLESLITKHQYSLKSISFEFLWLG